MRLWPPTPHQRWCSHGCLMLWAAWKKEPLCLPSQPPLRKWRRLQSTRGRMTLPTTSTTITQHMQLDSVSLAHRRTLYSIWQARTGSGSAPWPARCFAPTAGLLSCPSALLCGCRFSHAVIMLLCLAEAALVCLFFWSWMKRINWQMLMCFVNCGTVDHHQIYNTHCTFVTWPIILWT